MAIQFFKPNWRAIAFNTLLIIVVVGGVRLWQQRNLVEGAAPLIPGVAWQGQPRLVHFWATWCPVCRAEQDSIAAFAKDHPETVTIAMRSGERAVVEKFMHEQAMAFPFINDPDSVLAEEWGVHAVPVSFIVDGAGQIRFREVGYTTGWGLRLRLWLAQF